jgi:hypothetical protein
VVWKMVPMCLFWCVWKEMNDRCFEGRGRTLGEILFLFYVTLYVWTEAYVSPLLIRFSDCIVRFAPAS